MVRNEIVLSFCVWDFNDISHDELTKIFGTNPSKVHIKGEAMNPEFSPRLATENGWILNATTDKFTSFAEQMDNLLCILESRIVVLKPICSKYYCEFSLALFIYSDQESTPSVHLSSRYHALARELDFEFDLDLYCLQNAE
jgi:hypothetical protein